MRCEFLKKDCPVEKAARDACDHPFPSPSDAHAARGLLGAAQSYVDVPGSTDFPRRVLGVGARNRVGRFSRCAPSVSCGTVFSPGTLRGVAGRQKPLSTPGAVAQRKRRGRVTHIITVTG